MLKLSKKVDYALVALSHLNQHRGSTSAKEMADQYHLSSLMLANVLKVLVNSGMLSSKRGTAGGYALARQPKEIFLGEVFDLIDGRQSLSDCAAQDKRCEAEPNCPAKQPVLLIHRKIRTFIDNLTLADLSDRETLKALNL